MSGLVTRDETLPPTYSQALDGALGLWQEERPTAR